MRDEWEPKPFDFGAFERLLILGMCVIAIAASVWHFPGTAERSADYETATQECRTDC
jgi:ferric-dicitrate binding protein FerR (iron transport regulator)